MDKTSSIFNNPMPSKVIKGAEKSKAKYIKKYGDDSQADYKISFKEIPTLDPSTFSSMTKYLFFK